MKSSASMKTSSSMRRGGALPAAGQEQQARDELFAGAAPQPITIDTAAELPLEDQTVDQLVRKADNTHKETTAVAQRALRVSWASGWADGSWG